MSVNQTVPRYSPTVAANSCVPIGQRRISVKELAERQYINKMVNAVIHYAQSKLSPFPTDVQLERVGDVTRCTITVKWISVPPIPEVVQGTKPDRSL